jgi:hypothetical protein
MDIDRTYRINAGTDVERIELTDHRGATDEPAIELVSYGRADRDYDERHAERIIYWMDATQLRELVAAANMVLGRPDAEDLALVHAQDQAPLPEAD